MSSLQADIEARLAETAPDVEVLLAEVDRLLGLLVAAAGELREAAG